MTSINRKNPSIKVAGILPTSVVVPGTFNRSSDNNRTHEGGLALVLSDLEKLRRSVLTFLLWENQFYESGQQIADRICSLVGKCEPSDVADLAIEARNVMKLRHVPLLLAVEMCKYPEHKKLIRSVLRNIIQRPDELTETLSIYWRNELTVTKNSEGKLISQRFKHPMPMQIKRGLQDAFAKFDQYQILKWQEKDSPVTMANVIKLVHPNPAMAYRDSANISMTMSEVYKSVIEKTAMPPDTWESRLSSQGKEAKKDIFTDLLQKNELGSLALISNLRGMLEAGVNEDLIKSGLAKMNVERVLPYKFITAARYAPALKAELQAAMFRCVATLPQLPGKTVLLVDISGSMGGAMSRRPNGRSSELRRVDAAAGLCILAQSICEDSEIYLFDTNTYKVHKRQIACVNTNSRSLSWYAASQQPARTSSSDFVGFALADAISSMANGGTDTSQAVSYVNANEKYDRLIIFSDEESRTVPPPSTNLGYSVNIASGENGVGYGSYVHLNGFSEGILRYIQSYEEFLNK